MIVTSKHLSEIAHQSYLVSDPETVEVSAPISLGDVPKEIQEKVGPYELPGATVNELRHVTLLGPIGAGLTPEGDVILDCGFSGRLDLFERQRRFYTLALKAKREQKPAYFGRAHSMVGIWAINYFHWHSEFLAALHGVLKFPGDTPTFLVHPQVPHYAEQTLDHLGLKYIKIPKAHMKIRELIIPTTRRWKGRTSPTALRWLRTEMQSRTYASDPQRCIYISRRKAEERRIVNEAELWRALKKHGFRRYYTEDMSFVDQLKLFANAEMVVAPHGAGLTNAIYSGWEPGIVEIFGKYVNPCYFTIFSSLGYPYGIVMGKQKGKDVKVDVDLVLDTYFEVRKERASL